jgi:hypothetical protein
MKNNSSAQNRIASIAFGSEKALVLWPSKEQKNNKIQGDIRQIPHRSRQIKPGTTDS